MKKISKMIAARFIICICAIGFWNMVSYRTSTAQEQKNDFTSLVPQYSFPATLDEQEKALTTNPLLLRFQDSRKMLSKDPYRPVYHYVNPEGSLNDPNGLCFWQGKWHLFYQAYPPEDPRQHWGHAVSEDLLHWRDLPLAIYPNPEEKCFSGSTLVEEDRVIAIYHGIGQGTMVAVSRDPLLLNWEKLNGKAVIPLPREGETLPYNVHDPCIWKEGEFYYALTGGTQAIPGEGKIRQEFLHRSKNLVDWEYLHPFLENDYFGLVGDDGACPYFWPIGDDKHMLLHYSHTSGGKYLLGDYNKERNKFVVTSAGDFNHGAWAPGGVHAPSAAPDGQGGIYVIFNMNPGKPTPGWNQIMSLPRHLSLNEKEELIMKPAGNIESLRYGHQQVNNKVLNANKEMVLESIDGNSIEIEVEIDPQNADMIEMNILRSPGKEEYTCIRFYKERGLRNREKQTINSVITMDNSHSSVLPDVRSRPPESAEFLMGKDELLKLRIFIDKSIVEVFVNDKQCVAMRVYPGLSESTGVSICSKGQDSKLISLNAWKMKSIYD